MDRWGRRPTLLIGAALMSIFMYANAGLMGGAGVVVPGGINGQPELSMRVSGSPATGLIACTYLFVASYAPTWGPVSWVYPPELYPLRQRGKAVALATSANWAFNTALGAFTPPAFANIRYRKTHPRSSANAIYNSNSTIETYIVFGTFNFAMFWHVLFLFPETAGKTLEDTAEMFEDPNGIKYLGTPAWKTKVSYSQAAARERGDVPQDKLTGSIDAGHESPPTAEEKSQATAQEYSNKV